MYQHVSIKGTLRGEDLATDDAGMCLGASERGMKVADLPECTSMCLSREL